MQIIHTHIVPKDVPKLRLTDYAKTAFQDFIPARQGIKKAIKKGAFLIDGNVGTTGRWIEEGQVIQLIELDYTPPKIFPIQLEVIYEDEYIAIINKPGGYAVNGNKYQTIENALGFNLTPSEALDKLPHPRPAHRLDAPTCGLLLIAKTRKARVVLGKDFEEKRIQKRYNAVVIGKTPENGILTNDIAERKASTRFERIKTVQSMRNKWLSLVNLFPETGRKHQLRIHLSDFGYPILGDKQYGTEGMILKGKGLFLCAVGLNFEHPITKEAMDINIDAPNKFYSFMQREQRLWNKYGKPEID